MFYRVKKIYARVLADSSIEFSERELDLHANWLNGNYSFFTTPESLADLASWTAKFYQGISRDGKYNHSLLFELVSEKWLYILFKTKHYGLLFKNGLFAVNRRLYLKSLYTKLFKKFQ
jgi:hypothetical protein